MSCFVEKCQTDTYNFFYYGGRVCGMLLGYLSCNMVAELNFSFECYSLHFYIAKTII